MSKLDIKLGKDELISQLGDDASLAQKYEDSYRNNKMSKEFEEFLDESSG